MGFLKNIGLRYSDAKLANNAFTKKGVRKITLSDTTLPTIYFPQLYLSANAPGLPTTKKFFLLYSTDHGDSGASAIPANGALAWAECDDEDLRGFVERGIIKAGYQSETPFYVYRPNDVNGHFHHIYYHPTSTFPGNGGYQQTRLLTRSGGYLHDSAGWTDRGTVLGLINPPTTEDHTGYSNVQPQTNGDLINIHVTKQTQGSGGTVETIPKVGISKSIDGGYTWTRLTSSIDVTSFMPTGRQFHISPIVYFTRNSIQYAVARNADLSFSFTDDQICIAQCDGNYIPTTFIGNISGINGGEGNTNAGYYVSGDTLHIYYIMNKTELFHSTWDLKNLD